MPRAGPTVMVVIDENYGGDSDDGSRDGGDSDVELGLTKFFDPYFQ